MLPAVITLRHDLARLLGDVIAKVTSSVVKRLTLRMRFDQFFPSQSRRLGYRQSFNFRIGGRPSGDLQFLVFQIGLSLLERLRVHRRS